MLWKLITSWGAKRRGNVAEAAIREALGAWARGDLATARAALDDVLAGFPDSQGALYWSGELSLALGAADRAQNEFRKVLAVAPDQVAAWTGLAKALLVTGDEAGAFDIYCRCLPGVAGPGDAPDGADWPYRHAHPVWLKHVSVILPPALPGGPGDPVDIPSNAVVAAAPATLVNFASLLCRLGMASRAAPLFERALSADPDCAQAAAALALFRCLNRQWAEVIPAASAARHAGAELWRGCNDACLLAAAIETGLRPGEIDRFADWRGLSDPDASLRAHLEALPAFDMAAGTHATAPLTFFVACDPSYLRRFAKALVLSVREAHPDAAVAVHIHLFAPDAAADAELARLAAAVAPMQVGVSREAVDFDKFGGKGTYCQTMRFVRLYQWMEIRRGLVAMIDADSLVRKDLAPGLAGVRNAAFILERGEPAWHRHPAGLTVFRPTPGGRMLLKRLAALVAANALTGHIPYGLDQLALYVLAREADALPPDGAAPARNGDGPPRYRVGNEAAAIDMLDGTYCDTRFNDGSAVWSITQDKDAASAFARETARLLSTLEPPGQATAPA